mgnify:CR=1 FL=1
MVIITSIIFFIVDKLAKIKMVRQARQKAAGLYK